MPWDALSRVSMPVTSKTAKVPLIVQCICYSSYHVYNPKIPLTEYSVCISQKRLNPKALKTLKTLRVPHGVVVIRNDEVRSMSDPVGAGGRQALDPRTRMVLFKMISSNVIR
eukprot:5236094-Pyramimonas_sp.AAC.1